MPNVPTFINDRNLAQIPNVRIPDAGPGPDVGGMLREIGQGAERVGYAVDEIQKRIKQREVQKSVDNATMEYDKWIGDTLVGVTDGSGTTDPVAGLPSMVPDTGLLQLKGDAVANKSAWLRQAEDKKYRAITDKMDGQAKQAFDVRRAVRLQNAMERMTSHEATELRDAAIGTKAALAKSEYDEALRAITDTDSFDGHGTGGAMATAAAMRMQGKTVKEIEQAGREWWARLTSDRVVVAVRNGKSRESLDVAEKDFQQADLFVDDPRIDPKSRAELRNAIAEGRAHLANKEKVAEADAERLHERNLDKGDDYAASLLNDAGRKDGPSYAAVRGGLDAIPEGRARPETIIRYRTAAIKAEEDQKKGVVEEKKPIILSQLLLGKRKMPDGSVADISPAEMETRAADWYNQGNIGLGEWEKVRGAAKVMSQKKFSLFREAILRGPLAGVPVALRTDNNGDLNLDDAGHVTLSSKIKPGSGRKGMFSFSDTVGSREFVQKDRKGRLVTQHEHPLLADAIDAMNVVIDQMNNDATITTDVAVKKFESMISTSRDLYYKSKAKDAIEAERALLNQIIENNRKTVDRLYR